MPRVRPWILPRIPGRCRMRGVRRWNRSGRLGAERLHRLPSWLLPALECFGSLHEMRSGAGFGRGLGRLYHL